MERKKQLGTRSQCKKKRRPASRSFDHVSVYKERSSQYLVYCYTGKKEETNVYVRHSQPLSSKEGHADTTAIKISLNIRRKASLLVCMMHCICSSYKIVSHNLKCFSKDVSKCLNCDTVQKQSFPRNTRMLSMEHGYVHMCNILLLYKTSSKPCSTFASSYRSSEFRSRPVI